MLPAASLNRKVTVVVPTGNRVELVASMPLTCGASFTGEGSRVSVAEPAARNAASVAEELPLVPAPSVAGIEIDAGGVTIGGVVSADMPAPCR